MKLILGMRHYIVLLFSILLFQNPLFSQEYFELNPSQSMLMTGKGQGQDAINNPYPDQDCIAVVENIGENTFSIRIQSKGKIIQIIPIEPETIKHVKLSKGFELYLDTDFKSRALVKIEKNKIKIH